MRRIAVPVGTWLALLCASAGVGLIVAQWWPLAGLGAALVSAGVSTAAVLFALVDLDPPKPMIRQTDGRPRATDRRAA